MAVDIRRLSLALALLFAAATPCAAKNTGLIMTLALNYAGRAELIDAFRSIVRASAKNGGLDELKIDEETISRHMYAADLPDPDLLIRTSGEMRLSNFLLWQVAYAELVVTDVLWPDFRRPNLYECIEVYRKRERRYGLTSAQVTDE